MIGTIRPNYLLDTVAAIAQLNGDPAMRILLDAEVQVSIPIIALGELYAGAEKSNRAAENLKRVDQFAAGATIVFCDQDTAVYTAELCRNFAGKVARSRKMTYGSQH